MSMNSIIDYRANSIDSYVEEITIPNRVSENPNIQKQVTKNLIEVDDEPIEL